MRRPGRRGPPRPGPAGAGTVKRETVDGEGHREYLLVVKVLAALLALVPVLFVAACATTYQPLGPTGGYEDYQAAGDQYEIYFRANGYTSPKTVYQFFLMRAAQIAMQNQYPSFYVLKAEDWSTTDAIVTPGRVRTVEYVNVYRTYSRSRYGNVGFLDTVVTHNTVTIATPPQVTYIYSPGFHGRIQLVKEPLKDQPPPFDALQVYDDGLAMKDQIDSYNRQVSLAGGVAVGLIILGSVMLY